MAKVSLIFTVKDEMASIGRLLESIAAQTRLPDEVVVVDGGSRDGTPDALRAWGTGAPFPVRVEVWDGANISQGRNRAIKLAQGPLIAATDAGVWLDRRWLEELIAPLEEGACDIASGFFLPDPACIFQVALAATTLPELADIRPAKFLPSSRSVAFTKIAWEAAGGYPEWLDYCEDLVFDLALKKHGYRFKFVPEATAHFRPRENLAAFFRQYYRYGRGDGKAALWAKRHLGRYVSYLVLLPLTIALAVLLHPPWLVVPLLGAGACLCTPYKRLVRLTAGLPLADKVVAALWVPFIRLAGDVAKMAGYPVGVLWRWRSRP